MGKKLLCVSIALALASCGGDSGGGGTNSGTPPVSGAGKTGVFLDSPVAGIGYRTASKSGVTNALGEYQYADGETVTFFIGDLELPPVSAKGVVTPLDMAAYQGVVTDILQLLQSLDEDANPANGIQIHAGAAEAFTGTTLLVGDADFDTDVLVPLGAIGDGLALVTEEEANAHFSQSQYAQLLGSWVIGSAGDRNVLTFIDDSRYIIIHEQGDGVEQAAGSVEYGNYFWDPLTGDFSVSVISESDGSGGLSDNMLVTVYVSGNTLALGDGTENPALSATRISSTSDTHIGSWLLASEINPDDLHVLTFLSASEYVVAHTLNAEAYSGHEAQPLSGEFGQYSLQAEAFTVSSANVDTDGTGGLYNAEDATDQENETLQLQLNGDLLFDDSNDPAVAFVRIGT